MKKITLLLLICNLMTVCAFAQTIRFVKTTATGSGNGSSWENASGNLQVMINASNVGDQVWVGYGTYPLAATLEMKNGVNIYGGFFGNETSIAARQKSGSNPWEFTYTTILHGQNQVRVLNQATIFAVETVWDGVTITGGRVSIGIGDGGGAYLRTNGKLINCIITGNRARFDSGGGIYNAGGIVSYCMVNNNIADAQGGGVYNSGTVSYCTINGNIATAQGGGVSNIGGTVTHCTINENTTIAYSSSSFPNSGGGIYNNGGIVSYCTISGNTASGANYNAASGGGIGCANTTTSIVRDCIVENNKTVLESNINGWAGGIYQGNVSRCIIRGNSSQLGGGLYNSITTDCLIINNNAIDRGGGSYLGSAINCTYVENTATTSGGGSFSTTATNCIFWRNSAPNGAQVFGGTVTYSAIQGGFTGTGNISLSQDNISGGPMFVNPNAQNYQLQPCSPCVNTGSNGAVSNPATAIDLAGNPRIYQYGASNGIVDMGAYEAQSECFIPVTNIINVPTIATAGTPLTLTGVVIPNNATNQTITWSVASQGTTGATISGNIFNAVSAGTAGITATIINGLAIGSNYTQDFNITVVAAPVITTTTLPDGVTGTAYNQTLTATGTTPITWTLESGSLPTGLTLSEAGVIFGTPTVANIFSFTVKATNSAGNDTKVLNITVTAPPVITTTTLPNGITGTVYNQTLTATGTTPITWSLESGNLPTGLTLSAAGVISGTPTEANTFNFTVKATNSVGSDTKALSIVVTAPPIITTTALPNGITNTIYNQTLTAIGTTPITWSLESGNLPTGLTLSAAGVISGTPTAAGTSNFTVKATNSVGNDTKALSIVVNAPPVITTTTLPSGLSGTAYSAQLAATGSAPITWSLESGNLPTGLTLSTAGLISGTSTATGTSNFTVKATNSVGSDTKALSITINTTAVAPVITTTTLPNGTTGTAYSAPISATGTAPITWSLTSGSLPVGLTLSGAGVISGTPTTTGTFNFTVKAENSAGSDTKALSITIITATIPPVITTITLSSGLIGTSYSEQLTATGTAPITWSLASGSLPTGLTLYGSGAISGTPTTAGTFNFTVQASNSAGSDTKVLSIYVNTVDISENGIENILFYPNPTTGELRVKSYELGVNSVEVFDVFGRKLLSFMSLMSPETTVDISYLSAGVYFVKIYTEKGEVVRKVIKN